MSSPASFFMIILFINIDSISFHGATAKLLSSSFKERFFELCPLATSTDLPFDYYLMQRNESIRVNFSIEPIRVIELNDLGQSMSIYTSFFMFWRVPCNNGSMEALNNEFAYSESSSLSGIRRNASDLWFPPIQHLNPSSEAYPLRLMNPDYLITPKKDSAAFVAMHLGVITTSCDDLSFRKFPFDIQTCTIELETAFPANIVMFDSLSYSITPGAKPLIGETDIWELILPLDSNLTVNDYAGAGFFSHISLKITLRRKYYYYIGSIFVPVMALFAIQMLALFIEPSAPDRPAFCMTVVLSFAVLLSLVFAAIPKTSEQIYVISIVLAKMLICVIFTMYTLIMSSVSLLAWAEWSYKIDLYSFGKISISLVRLIDITVGVVSTIVILIVDFYYVLLMIQE